MMRIICCTKQVPETPPQFDKEKGRMRREEVNLIVNPFDLHAVEEALRIKEEKGAEVIAISMGPLQAQEALRYTLSLGVDEAILLSDPVLSGSDTFTTSYALSQLIKKRLYPFHLILCGKQAIDGDTAQVGPQLAFMLNLPVICYAERIKVLEKEIEVERSLDSVKEVLKVPLPCLVTVKREMNKPRLPSLRNVIAARKKSIKIVNASDIGLSPEEVGILGSLTKVVDITTVSMKREGKEISVEELVSLLRRCKG